MVSTWTPCGVQELTYKPAQKTALHEGWKPQSHHERLVTTQGNHRRVETTESPQSRETTKGGNQTW